MQNASRVVLDQIKILAGPPTNGRSFIVLDVYGRGAHTSSGEAWKQTIFDGLSALHDEQGLKVAYVDFSTIWDAVLNGSPGYEAFGFVSTNACADCTADCDQWGWCKDPDHYFSWFGG